MSRRHTAAHRARERALALLGEIDLVGDFPQYGYFVIFEDEHSFVHYVHASDLEAVADAVHYMGSSLFFVVNLEMVWGVVA